MVKRLVTKKDLMRGWTKEDDIFMSIATRKDELPLSNFVKREVDSWTDFYSRIYRRKEKI